MLVCLGANGSTEWTLCDPRVSGVYPGADGNLYLQSQTPSIQANISNTVICISGGGVERWAETEPYALSVWATCPDGTAILRHQVYNVTSIRPNKTMEELISISPNGTVLGKLSIPFQSDLVYEFVKQSRNGTFIISISDYYSTSGNYTGWTKDLQSKWSMDPVQLGYESGSVTYRLHNSTEIDGYGLQQSYTTFYAIDTENQSVLYETRFHGRLSLACINDGIPYVVDDTGRYWAVQPDGRAYGTNRTAGWSEASDPYGNGLLLLNHAGVRLISDHGDVTWQYLLESGSASSVHVGTDGTILLITDDGITAFHKPQVTTTTVYLMGLMAIDLLVALVTMVWIIDHRFPEART